MQAKPGQEISPDRLRSPDDPEDTYHRKGDQEYEGYVTAVTETAAPENPFQLVVKAQTAPNNTDGTVLLAEVLPDMKERTGVEVLYNDGGFCGPGVDEVLREQKVVQVPTDLRGRDPNPGKLNLANFEIQQTNDEPLPTDRDSSRAEDNQQALNATAPPVDAAAAEPGLDTTSSPAAPTSQETSPEPTNAQCLSAADEQTPATPDAPMPSVVEERAPVQAIEEGPASAKPATDKPCAVAQTAARGQITCPYGQKPSLKTGATLDATAPTSPRRSVGSAPWLRSVLHVLAS